MMASSKIPVRILGFSAYYHDSAACLLEDGHIVAAAQEERFTRKKHEAAFPKHAIQYCLNEGGVALSDVNYVVFYEKSFVKFERLLETYLSFAPKGITSFWASIPLWLKEKLFLKNLIRKELGLLAELNPQDVPPLLFPEHHQSHAAAAFFPSPFNEAAVLCMDGVGEWATTSAWLGRGNCLDPLWELPFPHSLGLLYSAFTSYAGFKVNSGEYKVMGLAPYGQPDYVHLIYDHLIDLKPDGTFRLNMEYFNYCAGLTMTSSRFHDLFGGPPRTAESALSQRDMNLARSIQDVTEEVMVRLARTMHRETGVENLCLAGGVALNCVGNGKIHREGIFKNLWIQPAAGDAGAALGAAMAGWHQFLNMPREDTRSPRDTMRGAFLGPAFSSAQVRQFLDEIFASYVCLDDNTLFARVAEALAAGKVVGWFQGRMEFGPRSLGGRSILGDARNTSMQSVMNLKIKYRESFRPFAPSVIRDQVSQYFDLDADSPYMLLVAPVRSDRCASLAEEHRKLWGIELLNIPRSDIPAVTHIDYSARVQTVTQDVNPRYFKLLKAFEGLTGCAVLVNTSFNVRGEPIVCSPRDAYRCFMRTEMDLLVLEDCVLLKADQKAVEDDMTWKEEFELD